MATGRGGAGTLAGPLIQLLGAGGPAQACKILDDVEPGSRIEKINDGTGLLANVRPLNSPPRTLRSGQQWGYDSAPCPPSTARFTRAAMLRLWA